MRLFSDVSEQVPDPFLRQAYRLAERGRGTVSPNPLVGCVVVRDGHLVGEGFHLVAGGPHAEVVALESAGERARGADVYVTLEPCNHYGRTPPCVSRLVKAGVARVVIGLRDPNPDVAGGGAEALRASGVKVDFVPDSAPFALQNEAWLRRLQTGLPWIRVKVALSLDGSVALKPGRRSAITGEGGRKITMALREMATALAVGASTVRIDDPALTVRTADDVCSSRQPRRVVLARTTVPECEARVFADGLAPATLVISDEAPRAGIARLAARGVPVRTYPLETGLQGALAALAADGVDDVLLEAGPGLSSELWRRRLIDELICVHAGGMAGPGSVPLHRGPPDALDADLLPLMRVVETGIAGADAVSVWRPGIEDTRDWCIDGEETTIPDVHGTHRM